MKNRLLLLACCSLLSFHHLQAQEVWTIGPMLHLNFGGEKMTTSFAIEAAYWNIDKIPYSVDFAIEFDRGKSRLYSELQTGIGVAGIAAGPVLEFNRIERKVSLGMQGSLWANYFIGFDYRLRVIGGNTFHAPGIYGKLPFATYGFDEDGNSSDFGDFDGWD